MSAGTGRGGVLIVAGGTGGHIYPALAVAEALRAAGTPVAWLGARGGMEARLVPAAGFAMHFVRVRGLRGKGVVRALAAPFALSLAVLRCLALIGRLRPSVVLGMGGFVSGPGGVAAWLCRRPLVVHEQNAAAGLTNRLLAPFATRVLEAFPGSFPGRVRRRARWVGNPVRTAIARLPEPGARAAARGAGLRVLVLGGSQGARALNETVPAALAGLDLAGPLEVLHQTGEEHLEATRAAYRGCGVAARLEPFLHDMAGAYGWADLVICRAGAMTVAELAAAGVAAVLVPYPFAVDDHQRLNARFLVERGAGVVLDPRDLSAGSLRALLAELAGAPARLLEMAGRARALAAPEAAEHIAQACLEVARG